MVDFRLLTELLPNHNRLHSRSRNILGDISLFYTLLVPIYQIRKELGDRVTRAEFNKWMTQMQVDEVFEFSDVGKSKTVTPERAQDSIKPPIGGIWYFAQLANKEESILLR